MFDIFKKKLEENWKFVLVGVTGVVFGSLFFGKIINGVTFFNANGEFGFFINPNQLPKSVDITGEWVYAAETNDNRGAFSEDKCRKRFGTVQINQKADSYAIDLSGERKIKEDCGTPTKVSGQDLNKQVIRWNSENAVILVNEKRLFLWFATQDQVPRYGYISATIIKAPNDIKPSRLQGNMYYLENSKNTWFRAKIDFYKSDSQDAKNISKKW
jgi:hypothetical protein